MQDPLPSEDAFDATHRHETYGDSAETQRFGLCSPNQEAFDSLKLREKLVAEVDLKPTTFRFLGY